MAVDKLGVPQADGPFHIDPIIPAITLNQAVKPVVWNQCSRGNGLFIGLSILSLASNPLE
jgi:hypothetical protein